MWSFYPKCLSMTQRQGCSVRSILARRWSTAILESHHPSPVSAYIFTVRVLPVIHWTWSWLSLHLSACLPVIHWTWSGSSLFSACLPVIPWSWSGSSTFFTPGDPLVLVPVEPVSVRLLPVDPLDLVLVELVGTLCLNSACLILPSVGLSGIRILSLPHCP